MENEKLALLHDHYKETFSYIRDWERQRDRLFLVVIGLFGLLATAILFSAGFSAALKEVGVAGSKADLSMLPAGAILGATWVFTLAMTLRYCQVCIVVERQYPYLHTLEQQISQEFGDDGLYQREGRAYTENYPAFSQWAWVSYVYTFPVLAIGVAVSFIVTEWLRLPSGWTYKTLDAVLGLATCTTLFLYRVLPAVSKLNSKRLAKAAPNVDAERSAPAATDSGQ
jgi:hypothetical protein